MKWPRWTLREVLLGVALISVSVALASLAFGVPVAPIELPELLLRLTAYLGAGSALGAGIGTFTQRPVHGAVLGFVYALVVFIVLFSGLIIWFAGPR